MSSPLKRPPSADYVENIPVHNYNNNNHPFASSNATFYYNGGSSPLSQPYGQHQAIYSYMSSSPSMCYSIGSEFELNKAARVARFAENHTGYV